ncbi:hypothetical protein MP638_000379 [Amoeboaphelidium occidentale]|nr:hypothetical protein MP638_000379 [Amoeboaphelidium occidentale]
MTWTTFFACALTAYGPPLALFFYGIAPSAQLVLLFLAASFTWLISILFSSIITIPLQNTSAFNIFIAVSAQEVFRYLYYRVLMKAEKGLEMVSDYPKNPFNKQLHAFASGLGFGLTSGLITFITPLSVSSGPGNFFLPSCPAVSFFYIYSILTLLSILLNVTWMMMAFTGYEKSKFLVAWVVLGHFVTSYSVSISIFLLTRSPCSMIPTCLGLALVP